MKKIFSVLLISAFLFACNNEKENAVAAGPAADKSMAPVELIMDSNLVNSVMATFTAFENKDVDGFTAGMDDNVMYRFSGGDSLVGKKAVKDYYTGRMETIENIKFSNHIMLPLMANQSPNGGATPSGKWMLYWSMVDVTYKNGKSLNFWIHNAQHYNTSGMVDQTQIYIDRHPIIEASK